MKHLLLLLGNNVLERAHLLQQACAPADYRLFGFPLLHAKYAEGVRLFDFTPGLFIQPATLAFLKEAEPVNVVAYAASLDNETFLWETTGIGYEVCVARLQMPESLYSKEESVWRPNNPIPPEATPRDWWLDGTLPSPVLVARLRLHPAVRAIWQGSPKHYVHSQETIC